MTTEQATPDKDMNRNPNGIGGFGDNPQNRNPGGWDKTQSISYQYNRILRMTDDELAEFSVNIKETGTQAERIALKRVMDSYTDLATTKEITDRTEGKAPQSVRIEDITPDRPFKGLSADEIREALCRKREADAAESGS